MAPTAFSQLPDAVIAQDTFDAKLNQTIFVIAFVVAGLIQLTAVTYLCFWLARKYRSKRGSRDTQEKPLPKQLLLPSRAELSTNLPRRLFLSPLSTPRLDRAQSGFKSKPALQSLQSSTSIPGFKTPTNTPTLGTANAYEGSLLVRVTTQTEQATPTISTLPSPSFEVDLDSSNSNSLSFGSASTIVEVIESIGFGPRIVVEDFAPMTPKSFSVKSCDSDSDSDMSIDDEKINTHLLVVPPMSWMAPRELVDDKAEAPQSIVSSKKKKMKPKTVSSMLSIFSDISNVARLRPRLPSSISSTFTAKALASRPSSRTPTHTLGRLKENTLT